MDRRRGADGMNFRWLGPLALLAALVIADQIRINRPGHKYRLTVEVETPEGGKLASGVMAVHPDRSYSRGGHTRTRGDAVFVDLGGSKNLVALLAHLDKSVELDDMIYPERSYSRGGHTRTRGDAVFVDLGGSKNLVALLAHLDKSVELDDMNYLALRAYNAAGRKGSFNDMNRRTGAVPVQGGLIPVLVRF